MATMTTTSTTSTASTPTTPIPLWLDCDPGHDDAFAILMAAYHPSIDLLGISTVFGNAPLSHTTKNAVSILTAIAKEDEVPVYAGAAVPLSRPPLKAGTEIHGESGLDGTDLLPAPRTPVRTDASAVDAMARALLATPAGTAWLVATGSLTNVALLLRAHPSVADHVAGLSIMGGAVGGDHTDAVAGEVDGQSRIGNTTPFAEFNILLDPEAAAAVLAHPRLAPKTTMVPLDLTHLVLATPAVQDLLLYGPGEEGRAGATTTPTLDGPRPPGKTLLRTMLVQLLTFFADTYHKVFGITAGPPLHDPIAVAAVLTGTAAEIPFYDYDPSGPDAHADNGPHSPGTPPAERYRVDVVTDGTTEDALAGRADTGQTVVHLLPHGEPGVRIPRGLDIPLFWSVLEQCCARADEANVRKGRKF